MREKFMSENNRGVSARRLFDMIKHKIKYSEIKRVREKPEEHRNVPQSSNCRLHASYYTRLTQGVKHG